MLIYDKLGYNKVESRYIHELLLKQNRKYKENYYNEEHHNVLHLLTFKMPIWIKLIYHTTSKFRMIIICYIIDFCFK